MGNRNHWELIVTYVKYVCQIGLTKDADQAVVIEGIFYYEQSKNVYNYIWSENLIPG